MQEDYMYLNEIDDNVSVEDVYAETVVDEAVQDDIYIEESIVDDLQHIRHIDLLDRDLPNQHTIASISGLRDELDRLELAHTHVRGTGYSQYYPWADNGPSNVTDRIGCFVSVVDDGSGKIKLCSSADEDVLGVIVPEESAGFIGNTIEQSDVLKYGLVCLLGTVNVRVISSVNVGDYVVPNALGIAGGVAAAESYTQTIIINSSDYYTLKHTPIALPKIYTLDVNGEIGDTVTIGESADGRIVALDGTILNVFVGDDGYHVGDRLCVLYDYVKYYGLGYKVTAITNSAGSYYATISLIPNGNALHRLQADISDALDRVAVADSNAVAAMNRADDAYGLAELVSGDINTDIFEQIQESINKSENANNTANDAVNTVNKMSQAVVNIENIANDAKKEAAENSSEIESLWAEDVSIQKDMQSLRGKIDKYTVGPHSQADGLTFEHAIKILPVDIVYIPTEDHTEQYESSDGSIAYRFYKTYSYVWDGSSWQGSSIANVWFSGVYITGTEVTPYWYTHSAVDVIHGNTTYPKQTLFVWADDEWRAIATLDGNALSRVVSLIQNTENSIKLQITNVRDDYALISARVDDNETEIKNMAKFEDAIAVMQQRTNQNEASITQLAQFGYEVLSYEELNEAPTNGPFYIDKPEWDGEQWVFTGSSYDSAVNINGIEYCYAANPDTKTYSQYKCGTENQWSVLHIGRAAYISGIEHKASQNETSLNMIVSEIGDDNGNVNAASIAMKINEDSGSEIKIRADRVDFDAGEYTIDSSHFTLSAEQVDVIASKIDLTGYVKFENLEASGQTTIDGANIKTGAIESSEYAYTSGYFSDNGTSIDLASGAITSKNFAIDEDGNAHFSGTIQTPTFSIDENGNASFSGEVQSPSGAIGGFTIDAQKMYTQNKSSFLSSTTHGIYIGPDGISVGGILMSRPDLTTYYANVSLDASTGKLIANNAEITGNITATSGYIGDKSNGFVIEGSAIRYNKGSYNDYIDGVYIGTGGIGLGSGKFYVTSAGKMYANDVDIKGKITATSGEFKGKVIATSGEFKGKVIATEGYIGDEENGFTINNTAIRYNKTTYNDNYTGVYIGTDGIGLGQGEFYVTNEGFLYTDSGIIGGWNISDSTLTRTATTNNVGNPTWTLADNIKLTHKSGSEYDTWLEFGWAYGSQLSNGKVYPYYGFTTNSNLAFKVGDGRVGKLAGTWELDTGAAVTSWRGAKHDIESLDDRYSLLFDTLNPVRFKYNNGQSDRYHTGFILDELKDAMVFSGVDSSEFAAYCVNDEQTGEGGIRYEEIIALLVKEVQELKKEIKEIKGNE